MLKTVKLRKTAAILAIIGGITSVVSGSMSWVPYVVTGVGWGLVYPFFGFIGFVLGMLIVLGGMLIIRGRIILGGNLAIWSGIANWFFGFFATAQAIGFLIRGLAGVTAGFIFGITLAIVFPVLGGVLGLMSGRSQKNETSQ